MRKYLTDYGVPVEKNQLPQKTAKICRSLFPYGELSARYGRPFPLQQFRAGSLCPFRKSFHWATYPLSLVLRGHSRVSKTAIRMP